MTTYTARHNKRLGIWSICHNDWCERGETSIVAQILTTEDEDKDEATAHYLVKQLNLAASIKDSTP